jgi:pyridoxamine 5'-phosphate oxidase
MTALRNHGRPGSTPGFEDPLLALRACHAALEQRLQTLENLVIRVAAHGADEEARQAAKAVMLYFDTAARDHHHDEDEDLFPLLRALAARADLPEIGATLYELEREHAHMDALFAALRAKLDDIAHHGATRLRAEEVAQFAWLYRRHLALEAGVVLPFAADAMSKAQQFSLGERMAARRGASGLSGRSSSPPP